MALLSLSVLHASAQQNKKVKLLHSREWLFDKAYIDANRYIGDVQIDYEGTLFYCDSVHIFANENFDAYGNIRIVKGATYQLAGNRLQFDRAKSTAVIYENVVLTDRDMTLTTPQLSYVTTTQVATYVSGGKIVSRKNDNVLTSERGVYDSPKNMFFFRKNVVLKNPQYTVRCDTMNYHNVKEVAYFQGPTNIVGKEDKLYCENGWYDTKRDVCQFKENAEVFSGKTQLRGDSIYYDGQKGIGEVFRKVYIRDTTQTFFITGEYGKHEQKKAQSIVTKEALLVQFDEAGDSLFMVADTLLSIEDTVRKVNNLYGFHHVRMYREDLQGKCDSVVMSSADSVMRFYKDPVFWSGANQITGDSIEVQTDTTGVQLMVVRGNAFVVSAADSGNFNQMRGRKLTGYFTDNALSAAYIEGNGQLIYYPADDKKKPPKAIGLNKGDCSNIFIRVKDNEVVSIRLEKEANSVLHPIKLAPEADTKLENFRWRSEERPLSKADLNRP